MNVLSVIKLLIQLLPAIRSAILEAEAVFGASKGASKLAAAVENVSKVLPSADEAGNVAAVSDLLPHAISAMVGIMNASGDLPKAPSIEAGKSSDATAAGPAPSFKG